MSVLKALLQASKNEKGKCHAVYFEEVIDALHFIFICESLNVSEDRITGFTTHRQFALSAVSVHRRGTMCTYL